MAAFEVLAVWLELAGFGNTAMTKLWPLLRGLLELMAGRFLIWLSLAWGFVKSLKNRLLAMLLGGAAQTAWAGALLLGAAVVWLGVMAVWGFRLANWYGRLRTDGKPG